MMNRTTHTRIIFAYFFAFACLPFFANGQSDSSNKTVRESFIYIRYYVVNNQLPYLRIQTKNKTDGFVVAPKVPVKVYLNKDSVAEALVGQVITSDAGEATLTFPSSVASLWDTSGSNTFIARTESSQAFDAKSESITVINSKLEIDTVNTDEGKGVVATLSKLENGSWVPMSEVDMRLAIKRHGGNLSIGDEETYTTDSIGKVEGSFTRAKLPGDANGKLEIVAMVDDNDEVGTLETGMVVPWGTAIHPNTEFGYGERSLWSTGRKAPIWLLVIACSCIIGVWSVIIYLITRIIRIRKLGKASEPIKAV